MGPSGSGKDSLLAELRLQEPAQLLVRASIHHPCR